LSSRTNFETVLSSARAGEDWAWRALYADHAAALLGYLRAQRADHPEDVLGEVMLQIVRDLPAFGGGEPEFRAWAFTIAHHRLLDERRRAARRPAQAMAPADVERLLPLGDADEDAARALGAERVAELLAQVSPEQQTVILLRVLGDLTCEQVGKVLGKTAGAVKLLQHRGFQTLRRHLERAA